MRTVNKVQKAAYELIQSDARFVYSLMIDISRKNRRINSNYRTMFLPFLGLFADGAEQWCKKMNLDAPSFNKAEKEYYTLLRQSHKLFELSYKEYSEKLYEEFLKSERYFYGIRRLREKIFGYFNVGTDLWNGCYCGNTILCGMYLPFDYLGNKETGPMIRDLSIVAGEIAGYFLSTEFEPYTYNIEHVVTYKDFHFFRRSPLKRKSHEGFILFSILCSINYVVKFIEGYYIEETPQKFKYAYLQYYYLCDFIKDFNKHNSTEFFLDNSLQHREFRNCLAHYGLGQFMSGTDIIEDGLLKGLTVKAFGLEYYEAKKKVYAYLNNLVKQIEGYIY